MKETIKSNGRHYNYYAWEITKASANITARRLRKAGFRARVIKAKNIHHETIYRIYKGRADKR